ncbi:MAG: Hpt domain-containing protein [Candidatus Omnitrophica bacterium]|nr:Hpt domain-containing protein [Candidatus Omnitrophota bacterium]
MDKIEKQRILEELGGFPEDIYDDLVGEFIKQAKEEIVTLKKHIKTNNAEDGARIAHSIKGSSANLRLNEMQEIAKKLEMGLKEGAEPMSLLPDAEELERKINEFSL